MIGSLVRRDDPSADRCRPRRTIDELTPAHALFDLNGTLFDPGVIAKSLPADLNDGSVEAILGDAVLLGAVETMTGSYRDFAELLRVAAGRQLELGGRLDALDTVMAAVRRMRPFDDAPDAISTLRAAGIGVGVLTNSSTETARSLLVGAGLDLEPVVGTDEVEAFKPDPRIYGRGVEATGENPGDVVLITAHWWDALGAKRAGLQAAWVSRREGIRPRVDPAPDYEAGDLAAIARQIAAR